MTDVQSTTAELLAEKPALSDGLAELLEVDAAEETWTFEDVPLDSGTFGELVSRGVVEKRDGEYVLADRGAVRRALGVETNEDTESGPSGSFSGGNLFEDVSMPDLRVERPVATLGLVGALSLVVLFRVLPWPAVFRGGDVVLSGNDPYAYRYIVHQIVEASSGPLDFSVFGSLPGGIEHGEPLMVATLSWVSSLLGGTGAVGGVLAWYPVVSAVLTALLVYLLAVRVTDDRRVGIAAVALLAIMPGHAFRTGLGFADHHAFDYPWLALTALAVVSIVGRERQEDLDWRTWAWGVGLGVGVAGQTLAWDAGPLLLVPLGLFVVGAVPSWVRSGRSPVQESLPLLGGVGLASVLVIGAHGQFGWHSRVVALSPVLLLAGSVIIVGLGAVARRVDLSARSLVGMEALVGVGGFAAVWALFPGFAQELGRGVDFLLYKEGIAETTSIVSGDLGTIIGPIFVFGFALFLAVPYMGWAMWRWYRSASSAWLAVGVYGWWFLVLSLIQIRFAGQLALFAAVFGGLGFVHIAAWVDLAAYPRPFEGADASESRGLSSSEAMDDGRGELDWPERRRALSMMGLGLGVGSLGLLNTPIKHSQLLVDESMYEAARFMREYSEERGWEYPENYVFSEWGRNRVYNWFVNGESWSYGYAQSNYRDFITATDSGEWYERLRDRTGFVVTEAGQESTAKGETIHDQLWGEDFGLRTEHYRAVWTDDDSRRVFSLVPGAIVAGQAKSGQTASIRSEMSLNGSTQTIETTEETLPNGWYEMTIPCPGTYTIGTTEVTVTESDVLNNRIVGDREGRACWQLDEGQGEIAFDSQGNNHGRIVNGSWTRGRDGLAFQATGDGYIQVPHHEAISGRNGFAISAWIRTDPEIDYRENKKYPRIVAKANSSRYRNTNGFIITLNQGKLSGVLGDGDTVTKLTGDQIDDAEWHHIGLSYDGLRCRLFQDGSVVSTGELSVSIGNDLSFAMASTSNNGNRFVGVIDEVQFRNHADESMME